MNAAQRLEAILNYYGINAKSLSEKCGYGRPQGIYDVQNGKTKEISTTMANKILSVFPELNRVWLLTGEGNMINERNNSSIIDSNNNNRGLYKIVMEISIMVIFPYLCRKEVSKKLLIQTEGSQ